jgi:hypothetical protein
MSATSTTVTDPDGNQTVHDFLPDAPPAYQCTGHANQVRTYQGSQATGTLLKTVTTDYQRVVNPFYVYTNVSDTYVPIRTTTIWPDGKQAKTEQTPDSGQPYTFYDYSIDVNNPTTSTQYALLGQTLQSEDFDYGSGAPGAKLSTKVIP